MVWVNCGGRWVVARVVVTKGGGRCGRMADEPWDVFWESPCSTEPDYFGILSFQSKIFRLKLLILKVLNPKGLVIMFHRQNRQKYFV
jgi:hypothetical protein